MNKPLHAFGLSALLLSGPAALAAESDIEKRLEELQRQVEELKGQLARQQAEK